MANGHYVMLRCNARGTGHAAISYALAEDWIVGVAFAHAGTSLQRVGGNAEEIAAAGARLESALAELAQVEALRGKIGAASFALAHSDAQTAVDEAQDAHDALTPDASVVSEIFRLETGSASRLSASRSSVRHCGR